MNKKRVPLTLNNDPTRVIGFAEVDDEGKVTAHINPLIEEGRKIADLFERDALRAVTIGLSVDLSKFEQDRAIALINSFRGPEPKWPDYDR